MTTINDLVIKFGAAGNPQPITIAEQVYAGMAVGFGTVTQSRWRSNIVTVGGINFTLFPGIDSDGRCDLWIYAAYGEASAPQTYSPINRERANVDLQVSVLGVAQNLFGAGTTYSYEHQRSTWLRWQSSTMAWDTSASFINARIADGTFLRHDSRNVFGSSENTTVGLQDVASYQPFKVYCGVDQAAYIGDQPRANTGGGERPGIGPVHEAFAHLITEVGTNNNPDWLTPTRKLVLQYLAESAAQFPHASGLLEPVTNRLLDPSVKPHCNGGNPTAWFSATGIPMPQFGDDGTQFNCEFDNAHPLNKISFHAWHLSRDPLHLLNVQGAAIAGLASQSLFQNGRGVDGHFLGLTSDQERGMAWAMQMLFQAWHATPAGTMPKPFRDKAWFALAIDNTLQYIRDRYMSSTNHAVGGIQGEAMRFWRTLTNMGVGNAEVYSSRFQEDYVNIILAQALLLGYSNARDVAEWRVGNIQRRLEAGGSWFLNEYELETTGAGNVNAGFSGYAMGPSSGTTLPFSDGIGFRNWYPRKTTYTNGPTVPVDYWHQQFGRDTYLFLAAVNVNKEAARRGLLTPGFDMVAAETELRARFVGPFVNSATGNPVNYGIYPKQYFSYADGATVPAATVSSVTVSPSVATGSASFSATVNGSNGPSQLVTWTTTAGSITGSGAFTAPTATNVIQTITVRATSTLDSSKSGTATVTIAAAVVTPPSGPTVSGVTISPNSSTLAGGASQQFSATVQGSGSPSQAVTWSVSLGSVNGAGLYTAVAATGAAQTVTLTATSVLDPTKSASVTLTITALVSTAPTLAQARLLKVFADGRLSGHDYDVRARRAYTTKTLGARLVFGLDLTEPLAKEGTTLSPSGARVMASGVRVDSEAFVVGNALLVWIAGGEPDKGKTKALNQAVIHYKFANGSENEAVIFFTIQP